MNCITIYIFFTRSTTRDLQAIDALSLCDVDGRMFLELDEEDLAESEELGLEVRSWRRGSFDDQRGSPSCIPCLA